MYCSIYCIHKCCVSHAILTVCAVFLSSFAPPLLPSPPPLPSPPGATCLHLAAAHGRTTTVEVLLRAGLVSCTLHIPRTFTYSAWYAYRHTYLMHASVPRCGALSASSGHGVIRRHIHHWCNEIMCLITILNILDELIVSRYVTELITTDAGRFGHVGVCHLRTKLFLIS